MAEKPKPQPPRHGVIKLGGGMKRAHAVKHLALITSHANEAADYGGHGTFSAQGGFSAGGASGSAEYMTTSTGNTDTEGEGH